MTETIPYDAVADQYTVTVTAANRRCAAVWRTVMTERVGVVPAGACLPPLTAVVWESGATLPAIRPGGTVCPETKEARNALVASERANLETRLALHEFTCWQQVTRAQRD